MHRNYIISIYAAIINVVTPGISWAGVDPAQFFTQGSPQIIEKLEQKQESGRGVDRYVARDKFGNLLRVEMGDQVSMFGEIGGSLLAQGLELPALPIYPAFVQTDQNGKRLRASVRPRPSEWSNMRSVERLTPLQIGEWLGQMVFNHVLGNPDALTQADHIVLSGQHVMSSDMGRIFRSYERGKTDSLVNYLNKIPAAKLGYLTEKEATQALIQLNRYISRLEKLSPGDMANLFGAYFESAENLRRAKKLPSVDYRAELQRRIQAVRTDVVKYLNNRYPNLSADRYLNNPVRVDRPVFLLPGQNSRNTPESQLWNKFFRDPAKVRPGEDREISELLEQARKREGIYYVGPTVDPKYFDTELKDPPQTHLNPKNSKALIVVPTNDLEAVEIGRISAEAGAQVMKLDGMMYPHGAKLTPELANQIIERAQRLRVDTVAVVEMPGESAEVESVFSKHGLKFLPIDHHDSAAVRRGQPFSSLEQAAQFLGYDLGGMSKVVEVNDRSFLLGLQELGLSKEAVTQLFPPKYSDEEIRKFSKFKSSKFGDFYVLHDFSGNFSELVSAITIHEWPKRPNVMVLGYQLRFTGNPKFHELLRHMFREQEGQVKKYVYGGDMTRAPYWLLKGMSHKQKAAFNAKVVNELESALDAKEVNSLRNFLSRKTSGGSRPSGCVIEQVREGVSID